jgi:hypothetical protein
VSFGHQVVNLPEDAHQFIPDDTHLLDRYLLDLQVSDHRGEAVVALVLLLAALQGLVHLAHLQVAVLLVDPPDALLDLHLDGSVLHVFQLAVTLLVLLDGLVEVVHLLSQLLVLKTAVVETVLELSVFLEEFIGLLSKVLK